MLEKGSLPISFKSKWFFPYIIKSGVLDDKLLIDGGVANNFPVSILKSKGMDIVIGVDVEGELYEKDKLSSAVDILNQIVSYQMYRKSAEEKKN